MEYQVIIDEFQGPLDLLLHLIKEKKLNIEDLEVSVITDQYLDYIHQMQNNNLEIMSEYLVMAANLIEMKSKSLLPKMDIDGIDEYQEDPRQTLIKQLIEYKKYKDVLDDFKSMFDKRQDILVKPAHNLDEYVEDTSNLIPDDLQVYDLMRAMQKMFQRIALSTPLDTHIAKKDISIEQRSQEIVSFLKTKVNKKINLKDLFDASNRSYVIVTFLAVLVLVKDKQIIINQDELFDEIYLEGVG